MSTKQHTQGKVLLNATKKYINNPAGLAITSEKDAVICYVSHDLTQVHIDEYVANAELIQECFNVTNESGLTPSELLEQRNELVDILKCEISFSVSNKIVFKGTEYIGRDAQLKLIEIRAEVIEKITGK